MNMGNINKCVGCAEVELIEYAESNSQYCWICQGINSLEGKSDLNVDGCDGIFKSCLRKIETNVDYDKDFKVGGVFVKQRYLGMMGAIRFDLLNEYTGETKYFFVYSEDLADSDYVFDQISREIRNIQI